MELLTPVEMALADRFAIGRGVSGQALMERAGEAVAVAAKRLWKTGPIVVLAGPGNNGGDGLVAARLLRQMGHRVTVALLGERSALKGDARLAFEAFKGIVVPAKVDVFKGAGLIVDALFGAGVRSPLPGEAVGLIEAVNASGAPVLSVDLPSGVEGASGKAENAISAQATITFFRKKPGHVLLPGRELCGEVSVADIGIDSACLAQIKPLAFLNRPALWASLLPLPRPEGHKYDRGHLLLLAGPSGHGGAARLAARAGLRIGAGLATLAVEPAALLENAARLDALMLILCRDARDLAEFLSDRRRNSVVMGPGLGVGEETRGLALTVLASAAAAVLDADALTSVAPMPEQLFRAIAARSQSVVLTPHEGEFARLFGAVGIGSKLERARGAAAMSGAVVLLKGKDSVVAAPDGRACIADNAPSALATAGAGDVLAGMIGGLLAQGMPAFEAACAACYLHGEAAAAFGPGLIAEDIAEQIPAVLGRLYRSAGFLV